MQEGRGPTVPLLPRPQAAGGRSPGQLLPRGQAGHRDEEEGRATSGTAGTYQGEQAWASQKSHHLQVTFLGYFEGIFLGYFRLFKGNISRQFLV